MKDYNLTLITPPAVEPITPAEAIAYMRLDAADDYVSDIIKAAREYCEDFQHRAYITQTWELALQEFPRAENDRLTDHQQTAEIEIPKGCLQSVDSFTFTDYSGTVNTLVQDVNYIVSTRGILGRIAPPYAVIWPPNPLFPIDPIIIKFTCGYGDTADEVPLKVKQAMYMLIAYWYDNRPPTSANLPVELERAVKSLLSMDRIAVL
jgi:uncharacterized phiE125 gp8 family phage protein